ncbi:Cytochrome C oxidase, cbb3-type, subunit III [Hoeflea sp. IMCC20628]|uniref:c-type cytochrome n=1 Tax=Hoeflea sp. IMCC20628 TaxID=1620421 RepID=UPI00063AF39C|nr:cytochrome c [Hoeflea sp. IMCC20628]AKI03123.1 Cytochrome C oxidase, cbb3-type, subunit III [Hoeflea sp. IMCC20628]
MNWRTLVIAAVVVGSALFIGRALLAPTPTATGEAMASVVVPDLSPDAQAGEVLFNRSCATCHGVNAAGQDGVAPPLVHKIYEPNHHGDAAFHLAAKNGARAHHWQFGDMPPVEGITDPELEKVVGYVRELQRANGIN